MTKKNKKNFWKGKKTLVTGHTGFKGGWLSTWLNYRKSIVYGYSLKPPTIENFYDIVNLKKIIKSEIRGNITNTKKLINFINKNKIEIIFHMAAQSLVRKSYQEPLKTIKTNIMGTSAVLEAARLCKSVKTVIIITTDKVYKNDNKKFSFLESDNLGGKEIYCSSKASTELISESYYESFFSVSNRVNLATVRAGNVIGGGDWAEDRLIPDCIKSFSKNKSVSIRSPKSVRPWQHVLEPLNGYMILAEMIYKKKLNKFTSWNFGPNLRGHANVEDVVTLVQEYWPSDFDIKVDIDKKNQPYESKYLSLNSSKAKKILRWKPKLSIKKSIKNTIDWYIASMQKKDMMNYTLKQIIDYEKIK